MARQITELTAAGALDGTELAWVEQGGLPRKATTQAIADLGGGGGSQTPWTSDIDAASFALDNVTAVTIEGPLSTNTTTFSYGPGTAGDPNTTDFQILLESATNPQAFVLDGLIGGQFEVWGTAGGGRIRQVGDRETRTEYIEMYHNTTTRGVIKSTDDLFLQSDTDLILTSNACEFRVNNLNDYVGFKHNGTDFLCAGANTQHITWSGFDGDFNVGNYLFDANQSLAGADNYVLTYDSVGGKISLEAAAGGVTALSTGTVTATTYGITSDGGTDDVVLVEATTTTAGLLGADKWDEIVANTAKVSNATHTGDVTGSTALTIAAGAVDIAMLSATGTPSASTFLRGDNTWATVGGGTVTSVSVVTANGVSGSVATPTTTPAITLTLGAITPTSVGGITSGNLLDKTAVETISGEYTYTAQTHRDDLVVSNFGTGDDFGIFFDATDSVLRAVGATNDLILKVNTSQSAIRCVPSAQVELAHNSNIKLATTATGVDVTGTLEATTASTALEVSLIQNTNDAGGAELQVRGNGQGDGYVFVGQGSTFGGGVAYRGDGTSPKAMTGASSDRVTYFRRNAGVDNEVWSHSYLSDTVRFLGNVDFSLGIDVTGTMAATTVTGANVTSGENPGHTHTGTSISSLDGGDITTTITGSGNVVKSAGPTFTGTVDLGTLALVDELRTGGGNFLVVNVGESHTEATGQTGEVLYVNAEGGLQVNSSPDNWATFWAGRDTATICGSGGASTLPGALTVAGLVTMNGGAFLGDSDVLQFGVGDEASMFSNGTDMYMDLRSGGDFLLRHAASEHMIVATANAGVELSYNGVQKLITTNTGVTLNGGTGTNGTFRTVAEAGVDQITGCETVDRGGTFRNVGLATMIRVNFTANTTMGALSWHRRLVHTNATSHSITFNTETNIPDGAVVWVQALTGPVTLVQGSGVTITRFLGTGAPATGTATIALGGWATVVKDGDSAYHVMGLGMT